MLRKKIRLKLSLGLNSPSVLDTPVGTLSKPRRQRQRERHKTKGLMSKTIAVHVRYNPLYIS